MNLTTARIPGGWNIADMTPCNLPQKAASAFTVLDGLVGAGYEPVLYCGTHALMADIQVNQVIEFQNLFLDRMRNSYKDVLDELQSGVVSPRSEDVLKRVASDVCHHLGK